jgi:Amt family ammonium transporter
VKGLFYGGGTSQLVVQIIGSASCIVVVSIVSFVIFKAIRSLPGSWNLRLEKDLELEGIDISEHGNTAYHMEFGQGMSYSTPAGLPGRGLPSDLGSPKEPADSVH